MNVVLPVSLTNPREGIGDKINYHSEIETCFDVQNLRIIIALTFPFYMYRQRHVDLWKTLTIHVVGLKICN